MSLSNFIPTLWADTILAALQKNLVYGQLFNTDYEGQIQQMGDTVKINAIGDITISNYTKDTSIGSPQSLTDAQTMLTINNAKFYNFAIDDVDQMQSQPKVMAEALRWAGYRMADTMDQYYAGFYTDATNTIGSSGSFVTPVVGTAANAGNGTTVYDYLVQLGQLLTQQLTPKVGRWCVVPPWVSTLLTQDVRFTGFGTQQSRQTIVGNDFDPVNNDGGGDAYLGKIRGMDVYESVNAPHLGGTVGASGSQDVVFAGHSMAITKAEGLVKTEAYRPPDRFSDAVKGLCLYGAKTVRPYAVAAAYLQHP